VIGVLPLLAGLAVVGIVCVCALGSPARGRYAAGSPTRREQPHRQAIHHFASGAVPPWR
jgi:hypothetical protein